MAERLPVGAARNVKSTLASLSSGPTFNYLINTSVDQLSGQATSLETDSNSSSVQLLSNGSGTANIQSSTTTKLGQLDSAKNGNRIKESESRQEAEWVEQDEPGVYITLTSQPGGAKDLKRVRFRYAIFFYSIIHQF